MGQQPKERCANCGYLNKRNFCERYNIFMIGVNVDLCTCECFTTSEELADVAGELQAKNHSTSDLGR